MTADLPRPRPTAVCAGCWPQVTDSQPATVPTTPTPVAVPTALPGKNVNGRITAALAEDQTRIDWSADQWAEWLGCSPSAVKECLRVVRDHPVARGKRDARRG